MRLCDCVLYFEGGRQQIHLDVIDTYLPSVQHTLVNSHILIIDVFTDESLSIVVHSQLLRVSDHNTRGRRQTG